MAEEGGFLPVPEIYMDKIAVGPDVAPEAIDLDKSPGENLNAVAASMGVAVSDLQVCLLDGPVIVNWLPLFVKLARGFN